MKKIIIICMALLTMSSCLKMINLEPLSEEELDNKKVFIISGNLGFSLYFR